MVRRSNAGGIMKNNILKCLRKFNTLPFLFIGSGVSIRYIGLENWEGLLRKFANLTQDNEYAYEMYLQRARAQEYKEGVLPKVAELIENEFNKVWFVDTKFTSSRETYEVEIKRGTSPFKIEIAKYMAESCTNIKEEYSQEVDMLREIGKKSIGGIITTNYDCFVDDIFNEYKIYIGQEELIFSTIQGIAEIYKIHGCCTKPESIVINEKDYINFSGRNTYLAAKILTIFLEHPVIFMGYSISDKNIENILKAIVRCLSPSNLIKLKERLIFIEWNNTNEPDSISTYSKSFDDGKAIDMTRIKINDYAILYHALLENKAKYNAPVLRRLKRDIYELVLTNKPTDRMRVIGLEDEKLDEVDMVIGVGIIKEFGAKGYAGLTAADIYADIILDNGDYDPEQIVFTTLPVILPQNAKLLPMYKYISQVDCEIPNRVRSSIKHNFDDILNDTIIKQRSKLKQTSIEEILQAYPEDKSLRLIPSLQKDEINLEDLEDFIKSVLSKEPDILSTGNANKKSNLKRLIRIYDWLKYYDQVQKFL
jgi:hypothetical protein